MSDSVDNLDAEWRREENRKFMNALLIPTECRRSAADTRPVVPHDISMLLGLILGSAFN
jgi:hypothetical protein